jgi:alcohol dehydrogenase, propanol-preferring
MSVMYANELDGPAPLSERPLEWRQAAKPKPADGQILIEVAGCGVCRSNLHMIEGEWVDAGVPAIRPIVPGHEVTGRVVELGAGVTDFAIGEAVGVQPLWWTCEKCEFCTSGRDAYRAPARRGRQVRTFVDRFPMEQASDVLDLLAAGQLRSRAVLENVRS